MALAQEKDFSATATQAGLTEDMKLLPTSPELWAGREKPQSMEHIKLRQCKLGELFWDATVSRPDICACLARIASRINALCGSDVYRINELVWAAKAWQQATVLKFASTSHLWKSLGQNDRLQGALQTRGEQVHGGWLTTPGWPDAAYGGQSTEGKCQVGYVIGLMSSTLTGPFHILQRTSKFTRKMVKSSMGREIYALSEMADQVLSLKERYGSFEGMNPGVAGPENCESLAEKYSARNLLSIRQALEKGDLVTAKRNVSPSSKIGKWRIVSGATSPPDGRCPEKQGIARKQVDSAGRRMGYIPEFFSRRRIWLPVSLSPAPLRLSP